MSGRFQFSIRSLLVVTTAVAAGTAVACAERSTAMALVMHGLTLLFATATVVGVYQTTSNVRVFLDGNRHRTLPPGGFVDSHDGPSLALHLKTASAGGMGGYPAYLSGLWPAWWAAPINGVFAVFLHWIFSPRREAARLAVTATIAVLLFLVLLAATFFGGMRFGEWREGDRRDREEQAQMEEEAEGSSE